MSSDVLKPRECPFCGGDVGVADNTGPKLCTAPHAFVFCKTHGCPGGDYEQDTVAEAIAAWNTRTPDPKVQALAEYVKDVASQRLMSEMEDPDGDYDGAYEIIVERARKALAAWKERT